MFLSSMMSVGCLVDVSGTGLPLVVAVLVCSIGEWFVVVLTADSPVDSGNSAGVDADASGFNVAADLSSLRCLRFLRSDFPDEVCTIYDLGSTHLCVTTAWDHLLESGSYTRTRCPTTYMDKYILNRSQPKTIARSSRSMFAYLCSVSVSALKANAIGFPSCRRTAPRPCRLVSFDGLK